MRDRGNRGSPPAAALSPSSGRQRRVILMELLGRGMHASPRDGCNILECASVLAGEPWSSRPQPVHPALADVAEIVAQAGQPDGPGLLADLDATRDWLAEASRPTDGRLRAPWAGRRKQRMELGYRPIDSHFAGMADAAQAQPTPGKTESATTHPSWSANECEIAKLGEEVAVPLLIPSPDRG